MDPRSLGRSVGIATFLVALGACATSGAQLPTGASLERSKAALQMPMRALAAGYSDVGEYSCHYSGTEIHYNGNTTLQLVNCLLEAPGGSRTLVITSSGGNVDFAVLAGVVTNDMDLDVQVVGWCASSCANYILPAARRILVDQHSVVFVHGGPQTPDREKLVSAFGQGGFTEDSPGFAKMVDENLARSWLSFHLHKNFKVRFDVGERYYDLADTHAAVSASRRDGESSLLYVDPGWLVACLPRSAIIAEPPSKAGLRQLFPGYNLVSFSEARGEPDDCGP
jgi:hypothetical protein